MARTIIQLLMIDIMKKKLLKLKNTNYNDVCKPKTYALHDFVPV